MNYTAIDKINIFLNSYGKLFIGVFKIKPWFPLLVFAILQILGLYALSNFHLPILHPIMHPIISLIIPEKMLHYPQYNLVIPSLFSGLSNFVLGPIFWVILSAVAVCKINEFYVNQKQKLRTCFGKAFKSYFKLFAIWFIEIVLVLIVLLIPARLFAETLGGSPRLKFFFEFIFQLGAFVVSALLIYSIPGIMISKLPFLKAISRSVKLFSKNLFLTYSIVAIPGSLKVLLDLTISNFSLNIIRLFNPDLIIALLYFQIGLGIFINFFIYGAAVFVYNEMTRKPETTI